MFFQYFAGQKANLFDAGTAILCASARLCTFVFTTQATIIQPPRTGNISKVPNPRHKLSLGLALLFQRLQTKCRQHRGFGFWLPLCFPIGTEAVEGAKLPFLIEKCYFYLLVIVFQNLGRIDHMRGLVVNFLQGQFANKLEKELPLSYTSPISLVSLLLQLEKSFGTTSAESGKCGTTRESWKGWKTGITLGTEVPQRWSGL